MIETHKNTQIRTSCIYINIHHDHYLSMYATHIFVAHKPLPQLSPSSFFFWPFESPFILSLSLNPALFSHMCHKAIFHSSKMFYLPFPFFQAMKLFSFSLLFVPIEQVADRFKYCDLPSTKTCPGQK